MIDFFISYTASDARWAEWIAWQLEDSGFTTRLQLWDFRPGSNFVLEMQKAAAESKRTLLILSPDSLQKPFVQPEWAAAFAADPAGESGKLLPVLVRPCKIEGLLPQIVYIDLTGKGPDAARQALLEGVSRERAKPVTPPTFPSEAKVRTLVPHFPGAPAPIGNIPYQRNLNFTGREKQLKELHDTFVTGKADKQSITGLGGVGKTQVVIEYAYQYASVYYKVFWVRSEDRTVLASDYASLASQVELGLPDGIDQNSAIQAVRSWLESNPGWLLVFDNATSASALIEFFPRGSVGRILITSQNPSWRGIARPLPLSVWDKEEAEAFILTRTGSDDHDGAAELAGTLGYLPLAISHACAYIEVHGLKLQDYITLFNEFESDLLQADVSCGDYHPTLAATIGISMDRVHERSPLAGKLMNLLAILSPDQISLGLLQRGASQLPGKLGDAVRHPLSLNQLLASIREYSLVDVSQGAINTHRLVQSIVFTNLSLTERAEWLQIAFSLLDSAAPDKETEFGQWDEVIRHVIAALDRFIGSGLTEMPHPPIVDRVEKYLTDATNALVAVQLTTGRLSKLLTQGFRADLDQLRQVRKELVASIAALEKWLPLMRHVVDDDDMTNNVKDLINNAKTLANKVDSALRQLTRQRRRPGT